MRWLSGLVSAVKAVVTEDERPTDPCPPPFDEEIPPVVIATPRIPRIPPPPPKPLSGSVAERMAKLRH